MTRKMEYTAKDVDHAIQTACEALAVTSDQLEIEIVSTGSSGIFGLCRRKAMIRVSLKKGKTNLEVEEKEIEEGTPLPHTPRHQERKSPLSASPKMKNSEGEPPPVAEKSDADDEDDDVFGELSPIIFSPEIIEGIRSELHTLFQMIGFSVTSETTQDENGLTIKITGDNIQDIIGPEGQVLDSMQYLLRKIISKRFGKKIMFSLDAGDYRALRHNELEALALKLACNVKASGKPSTISALNPSERRIIHMTLQKDSTIRSRSLGEGIYKKIMIYLPNKTGKKAPRKQGQGGGRRRKNPQSA